MITRPKARKYRLRKGAALAEGVDPAEAVRAMLAAEAPANRPGRPAAATVQAAVPGDPAAGVPAAASGPEGAGRGMALTLKALTPNAVTSEARAVHGGAVQPGALRSGAVHTGEVASAAEVSSETDIAEIRKEGLTGRQLRLARRVAQKHGIAATSDFDAVRQLRIRGIDPFERSALMELVAGGGPEPGAPVQLPARTGEGEAGNGDARNGEARNGEARNGEARNGEAGSGHLKVQLPQAFRPAPAPAPHVAPPPGPGIRLPEDGAGEILQIQRDIARRRRRRTALLFARLAFFVALPTLIVGWYYTRVATPMYATHSEFVIQQAEGQGSGGLGGLFQGTGLAVQQDSTTVQSYLMSRDAMARLDDDLGFKAHFSQDWIDPIQRLEPGASNEAAYETYQDNVRVAYDPTEGILKMEVVAATPEASQSFSEALIGYAEEQVDNLTRRLREDQMRGAMESFAAAERRVAEAQERVLELQERLGVLDPASESGSLMTQITQFETELRQKQLELQGLLANARPNEARVAGVRGEIDRLRALVDELRASMTDRRDDGASLARVTGELRIAEADLTTRQLLLQQAAQQLEAARIEANRQVRYMAVGVSPVAPDEATYPRAAENTALAFLIFAGIYLMLSLTASVLREQVAA